MKSALFLLSVLLLAAQYYCAPQLTLSSAYAGEAPQRIIDNYPLVQPLKSISVTVKVVNTGDAWTADQVVFQLVSNTFGWTGTLSTTGAVAQGASATFTGLITAPNKVGVQVISLQAGISGSVFGPIAEVTVDIDCSDGDTCNGEELFVNNTCWSAELAPCGYSNECTVNTCNDTLGVCYSTKTNAEGCTACLRSSCTYLGCEGRQCGTDGCNGNCGQCAPGTYCDSEGQCITTTVQGTCTNPIPLFPANQTDLSGVHYVSGNTSEGYHYHVIPCNMFSTSPELVWSFTVPEGQSYGFDFRSYGPIEDTIMDVRKGSCDGPDSYVGCNDDGTPPGNYGSRVARLIGPGTYLIIVKGYDDTIQGVVDLRLAFAKSCVPKCNSQFCGDDECGGSCGDCGEGEQCTTEFKCAPISCVPDCTGKQCGLDGCGGYCGECTDGNLCNMDNNQCEYFAPCDGLNPVCVGCTEEQFCGSDCACYNYTAPLPDLYVDTPRLGEDIVFDQDTFKETSCAYREGCILGTGLRRLLRFSVLTTNQGHADIALPSPGSRPDLFSWSPCHGHYHFEEYAYYALLSKDGTVVVEHGRKQGYCVLDGSRQADGNIACVGTFTCSEQGISVGWADTYTFDLDCQWIDITDVPPGDYTLFVELNKARKIMESNYENNKAFVPVTVPIWNKNSTSNNGPTTTGTPISTTTGTSTTNGVGSTTTTGNAAVSTTSAASTIILSVFVVFVVILSML